MKIIAATSESPVLIEIGVTELRHITEWNGNEPCMAAIAEAEGGAP